ncbi:acyltransferase family protein [Streptomyces calidiresistens]|uniref:Acyltransferase n=2 Tax=Streptomyces calidiresistens TaxID=1485586 RepID=A0A7W3T3Q2_9ACTN|nr:acyltransferase [Streptomyces calidiresistens]
MDPAGRRDPWWDNARFVSATLIVVLHTVGSVMARHEALHALHVATWALRVPAFVILAGVFSSAAPLDPRRARALIGSILVPAAIFSLLFSLEVRLLGGEFTLHVTQLPWTLWFLMSLFFWRLLLPLVAQLRHPLTVTTAMALAAGYVEELGLPYSASRTVVYLPLFWIGWRIGQGALRGWFTSPRTLWPAVGGLSASIAVGLWWHREIQGRWLSMRHPYTAEPLGYEWAWVIRLAVLALAVGTVLCLLRLVPRRRLPIVTATGAAGFTVYLLHPLVILPFREAGWIARVDTPAEQVGLVLCGVALTLVLGSPPVRRLARPLVRPPIDRLLVDREGRGGGPRRTGDPDRVGGTTGPPGDGTPAAAPPGTVVPVVTAGAVDGSPATPAGNGAA